MLVPADVDSVPVVCFGECGPCVGVEPPLSGEEFCGPGTGLGPCHVHVRWCGYLL